MRLWPTRRTVREERNQLALPFQEYVNWFNYNGVLYPFQTLRQTLTGNSETVGTDFPSLAIAATNNSPVYTCMVVRMLHFAEARFQWQNLSGGRPGNLFGNPELAILEQPWPGATTGDLLARMVQDVDIAGNSFIVRQGDRLMRLRPDWVNIVLGSITGRADFRPGDPDQTVVAYTYKPGGRQSQNRSVTFLPETVAHFAPDPDPLASYRGRSWVTSIIRELQGDSMMTTHKNRYLEQGATVNLVVQVPATTVDAFNDWVSAIKEGHEGVENAYKTLFLAGGADAKAIGSDMQQMDFANVQGKGETRIAAAAGVPAIVAGFSESLQGSSLNEGNYRSALRRFADGTIRPLWRNAAGSLERILTVPGGSRLWYDDRDVAFLKEDIQAAADVIQKNTLSITSLIRDAGFEPDASVLAVTSGDLSTLQGHHSGLVPVQLHPNSGNGNANGTGGTLDPAAIGGGT